MKKFRILADGFTISGLDNFESRELAQKYLEENRKSLWKEAEYDLRVSEVPSEEEIDVTQESEEVY